MDAATVTTLLGVLEEQLRIVSDLTAVSKRKSQAIVDGSLDDLDVLLRGEQALIWQMGRLEDRRFQLHLACAQDVGLHPSQLTLERLRRLVAPEDGERWTQVAANLQDTVDELAHLNQLNTALVSQAMAYVDFNLQVLGAGNANGQQIYSHQGNRGQVDPRTHRLDNRM